MTGTTAHANSGTDYHALLQDNLERVFNERDSGKRKAAIRQLYADGATVFQPEEILSGVDAISEAVGRLHSSLPNDFRFTTTLTGVGHHGTGRLRWQGSSPGGPIMLTGTDVATVVDGKLASLHVILDPEPSATPGEKRPNE